jgi:maltooligosyltrehalose synthase
VESLGSFRARVEKTMLKLIREANVYTRWSNPDREYEELVSRFVARALDASGSNDFFLDSFVPWMAEVARLGISSLDDGRAPNQRHGCRRRSAESRIPNV